MVMRTMLIAGGGTGGHLFPGMAVAEEFLSRDVEHKVAFIGTEHGVEARRVPEAGYDFYSIRSLGIAGKGLAGKLRGIVVLPLGVLDALQAVRKTRPAVALGVGGFVSGPAILAARIGRVPCAIQEQNAAPGFANRILSHIVGEVFISFEPARSGFASADKKGRVTLAGNPVRKKIVDAIAQKKDETKKPAPGKWRLLVVGGSQGAHFLNMLVPEAAAELSEEDREKLVVLHQSGKKDRESVASRYRELGVEAEVVDFIEDMAGAYGSADLVVSRAGAGAVSEIALAGLPAVLVPYPWAASDHQAINAAALVESGAAVMTRESETGAKAMAETIRSLFSDHPRLAEMAKSARLVAKPEAAKLIVDRCLRMIGAPGVR